MKTPAKKATKASAKAPSKAAAPAKKVSAKSPAKTAAKSASAKVASKTAAKAVPKAVKPVKPTKPVAKAPAKKAAAPAAKSPAAKKTTSPKRVAKPVGQPASAALAKPKALAKSARPAAAPAKAKPTSQPAAKPPLKAAAAVAPTPAVAPAPAAPDLPVRATRPSARLAQITVPSMPPAVASTAAKASFLPQMPTTVQPVPIASVKKDPKLANNWKNKPLEQLSDADVLAMPDAEYMNDVQMAFFRLKLVQLKQDILNNAGETTEHLREDTVVVPDPADRATIEEEHALELRTRDRERKLLKKIEQSIARIDAGDYGYCDETGEPIGVGRLLARPTASLSIEAQQRRELKQKMFGD